jgi:regulatory protein
VVTGAADVTSPDDGDDTAYRQALERAGRLLSVRPRTASELNERVSRAGIEPAARARAIARLQELGLVNDQSFALQWIDERSHKRGRRALLNELLSKGVERNVAEAALEDAGIDEDHRAIELAAGALPKLAPLPLKKQVARLNQMLVRRGFSVESAEAAVKAVLPPEIWD